VDGELGLHCLHEDDIGYQCGCVECYEKRIKELQDRVAFLEKELTICRCNKCGQLLADVTNGSKVRKGLIVYCHSCFLVEGSSNIGDIFNLWK
jgi:hypothetical protein